MPDLSEVQHALLQKIQHAQDLSDVLGFILSQAVALLEGHRGDLLVVEGDRLKVAKVIETAAESLHEGDYCPADSFMQKTFNLGERTARSFGNVHSLPPEEYHCSDGSVNSEAAIILWSEKGKVGVLNVESQTPEYFKREKCELLRHLAEFAALALQLFDEETRLRKLIKSVLTTDGSGKRRDLPNILDEILKEVEGVTGFTRGLIYISDEREKRLKVLGRLGTHRRPFYWNFDDDSFASNIRRDKKPDFKPDVAVAFPEGTAARRGVDSYDIKRSVIGIPLMFGDNCVGVLVCFSTQEPYPALFHTVHLEPLATLAAWKIGAWNSEKHRQELQQHREEFETTQAKQLELFESLVKHLPFRVLRKDREHKFTYANEGFVEHLHRPKGSFDAQVKGKTDLDFYTPKLARKFQKTDKYVMDTRKPLAIEEYNQVLGHAEKVRVRGFKAPMFDPTTGEVDGVVVMFWDFSKRDRELEQRTELLGIIGKLLAVATSGRVVDDETKTHLDQVKVLLAPAKKHAKPAKKAFPPLDDEECVAVLIAMQKLGSPWVKKGQIIKVLLKDTKDMVPAVEETQGDWTLRRLNKLKVGKWVESVGSRQNAKWRLTKQGKNFKPGTS